MTTLLEVTVDGLAGRVDPVHYPMRRDVNIFFGLNGSGKTSLLKILHSGLSNSHLILTRVPFSSAKIKFASESFGREYERSISSESRPARSRAVERRYQETLRLRSVLDDQESLFPPEAVADIARQQLEMGEWVTRPDQTAAGAGRFQHGYLSTNRLLGGDALPRRSGPNNSLTDVELDSIFAEQIEAVWRLYTNRTLSEITEVQSEGLRGILQSLLFAGPKPSEQSLPEVAEAYDRASHFVGRLPARSKPADFKEFQRRFKEDPYFRDVVQGVDQIERRIEQTEEPRRRLAELISAFFTEGKTIDFANRGIKVTAGGREVPLAALSSGEKQLVRILIEVIRAGPNPVIIDEPELSMHIDWQRKLVDAIRIVNPSAQIIMATHSPDIMENVSDESIFRL